MSPRALASTGLLLLAAATVAASSQGPSARDPDGIRPSPAHPFYWELNRRPTLLLGGSDDDNLFQWPDAALAEQLDTLRSVGGNYLRNTMSDRPDRGFEIYPFRATSDGRFDLDEWNPEYWSRFERFLRWTADRGIVVQIEIWDRFDYSRSFWTPHPFNPDNNVNYTFEASGLAPAYPKHPGANEHPFFFTTPEQRHNRVVLPYQRRFVDRLLEATLPYGHVLYCIDNETSGEEAWGAYWAEYVKARARARGRQVYVTEMWDAWDIKAEQHQRTLDHPERYDFVDLSQNNHNKGRQHWENAVWARRYLAGAPRPINTVKTYGADGNRFGHTDQDGLERFFRHVLAGFASARFHRPDSGLGLNPKARAAIDTVRRLETLVELWDLSPAPEPLDAGAGREAYMAESASGRRVLYFPRGGAVSPAVRPGPHVVRWVGLETAGIPAAQLKAGGPSGHLAAPSEAHWFAVLEPRHDGQP